MRYLIFTSDYLSYKEGEVLQATDSTVDRLEGLEVAKEIKKDEFNAKSKDKVKSDIAEMIAKTKDSKECEGDCEEDCEDCKSKEPNKKESKGEEDVK